MVEVDRVVVDAVVVVVGMLLGDEVGLDVGALVVYSHVAPVYPDAHTHTKESRTTTDLKAVSGEESPEPNSVSSIEGTHVPPFMHGDVEHGSNIVGADVGTPEGEVVGKSVGDSLGASDGRDVGDAVG